MKQGDSDQPGPARKSPDEKGSPECHWETYPAAIFEGSPGKTW